MKPALLKFHELKGGLQGQDFQRKIGLPMPEWGKMGSEQAKVTKSSNAAFKRPKGCILYLIIQDTKYYGGGGCTCI